MTMNKVAVRGITKSGGQKHPLDKFYTKPDIAAHCIRQSGLADFTTIIEPSAGNGSFSNQIPNVIAMDLHPEGENILEQDWFEYSHQKVEGEKVLVIGNPPFGQQNNLAVRFINHAAAFADRIAFIIPMSFKKESVQNRINLNFHLTFEETLPKNSFTLNGVDHDVRCVFQIWDRKEEKRVKTTRADLNMNNLFQFVKRDDNPDFMVQRIGGRAGIASADWQGKNEITNYFVRLNDPANMEHLANIIKKLNKISYPGRDHAVGPRSISKVEMNEEVNRIF